MLPEADPTDTTPAAFASRVRAAVVWRSGTQIVAQLISWSSTLIIIRLLDPSDYGFFAMTTVVITFLNFLNGYGLASSLIQAEKIDERSIRQALGMLLLLNGGLAILQNALAPFAAAYFDQPIVASMLHWQSLLFLSTPFLVLPEAMLSRNLQFRIPAIITIVTTALGAAVALTLAWTGHGVWALVWAPIAIFWSRAMLLVVLTRFFVRPSFDFRGSGAMVSFGLALLISHGFWTIQSQADVFIAGRVLDPHTLGLYAEAAFLTTIFAAKFVPPLNEVAFPAYARIQADRARLSASFLKAVRLVMLISFPVYAGLFVTAPEAVATLFGPKWLAIIPLVRALSIAMPLMTLQILFAPALNAIGQPRITARISAAGAMIMPATFFVAVHYGVAILAWSWVVAFALLLAVTYRLAHARLGLRIADLARALAPGAMAALAMAPLVAGLSLLASADWAPLARFALLAVSGALVYIAILRLFAPALFREVVALIVHRDASPAAATVG